MTAMTVRLYNQYYKLNYDHKALASVIYYDCKFKLYSKLKHNLLS